jgi:3-hydroxyisobutyrate dehydrogenase-like beta-hydroxyacid dehydrogenase
LDGKIMSWPIGIARPSTLILICGREELFEAHRQVLSALGGQVTFVGREIGLAATLDAAHLSVYYGTMLGFLHGLVLCKVQGYPISQFAEEAAAGTAPVVAEELRRIATAMQSANYEDAQSTVSTVAHALSAISRSFRESGLNAGFPAFMQAMFESAKASGLGGEDSAALLKVLGSPS